MIATAFTILVFAAIALASIVLFVLYNGWAAATLWHWYLAPQFGELPFRVFLGAGFIVMAWSQYRHKHEGDDLKILKHELIVPGLAVALGWLFKLFL